MGLFSSKRVVTVDVAVTRLIEDIKNDFPTTVLKAVLNKKRLANTIRDDLLAGFASKAGLYYRYGRDHYSIGLPYGTQSFGSTDETAVVDAITADIGLPVIVNSVVIDKAIASYFAHAYGIQNYGYALETNEYSVPIGPADSRYFFFSAEFVGNQVKVTYRKEKPGSTDHGSFTFNPANLNTANIYYHVEYELVGDHTNKKYIWVYDPSTNVHPALNDVGKENSGMGFMPIIPLVKNKVSITKSTRVGLLDTASKMGKSIGLDIKNIADQMMSTENGNDPGAIDDAFLMYALDITTNSKAGQYYLFEFFSALTTASRVTEVMFDSWVTAGRKGSAPFNLIEINDDEAKTALSYNFIRQTTVTGIIGPTDTFRTTITVLPPVGDVFFVSGSYEKSYLTLRKQINATEFTQIEIHGLTHVSTVFEGRIVVRTLGDAQKSAVGDTPDKGFYIPVSKTIADRMPWQLKSDLYLEALVIVVYAVQISKVKWYQKKIFLRLVQIVLLVVAVVSQNYELIGAITTLQLVINVAISIIINIATGMLITAAITIVINTFGIDAGVILAIAAVVSAVYGYFNKDMAVKWAEYSAQISSSAMQATSNAIQKEGMKLAEEYKNLLADYKDAYETLEELNEDLAPEFDILMFGKPNTVGPKMIESPSDFYHRTVHLGNPGPLLYGMTEFYFDHMLQLPKVGS